MLFNTYSEKELKTRVAFTIEEFSKLFSDVKRRHWNSDWKSWSSLETDLSRTFKSKHEDKELQSLKDQLEKEKESKEFWKRASSNSEEAFIKSDKQLKKAEKVLEFYAKKENWTIDGHSFQDELNEIEQGYWACEIRNDGCDFNVATGYGGYGGKKARVYFQEKQDQLKGDVCQEK